MTNWKKQKLGEVLEIVMGQSPAGSSCNQIGEGTPLLNGPTEFGSWNPVPVQFTVSPKKYAEVNDLLFCVRGSTTGKMNWADQRYAIGRGLAAIRHKNGYEYQPFVKAGIEIALQSLLNQTTGSTFPNLSKDQLKNFEINLPDLPTQRCIAEILSALDDKITLNRRMNGTLEQMAQTLFRQYFVDGIDANITEQISLLDFANLIGGGTPKTSVKEYWDGNIAWVSAKDVTPNDGTFIVETERKITELGLQKSSAKLIPTFSTIITARGTVGKICIASSEMTISQSNYALKSKVGNTDFVLFQIIQHQIEELQRNSYGTVFDTVTTNTLRDIKLTVPSQNTVFQLEEKLKALYMKILANLKENITLAKTRDTLLPKLMSGEIDVMQAQKDYEPVLS
jgi:type I restriction enzyme S subunit